MVVVDYLETRNDFKSFIEQNKNKLIIVKASATWCGPCKRIKNDFMSLYNQLPSGVILIELDIDEADDALDFTVGRGGAANAAEADAAAIEEIGWHPTTIRTDAANNGKRILVMGGIYCC